MSAMTQMWGMFALLSILAALFVVVPFLRRERVIAVDSDANAERIAIFHQRLEDLEQEIAKVNYMTKSEDGEKYSITTDTFIRMLIF